MTVAGRLSIIGLGPGGPAHRTRASTAADLVLALYNPRSASRPWQLAERGL